MKLMIWKLLKVVCMLAFLATAGFGIVSLLGSAIALLTAVFNQVKGSLEGAAVFGGFFLFAALVCLILARLFRVADDKVSAIEATAESEGKTDGSGCLVWIVLLVIGAVAAMAFLSQGSNEPVTAPAAGQLPRHAVSCAAPRVLSGTYRLIV